MKAQIHEILATVAGRKQREKESIFDSMIKELKCIALSNIWQYTFMHSYDLGFRIRTNVKLKCLKPAVDIQKV